MAVSGLREGVDFEQYAVLCFEKLVELDHDVSCLGLALAGKTELVCQRHGDIFGEANDVIDWLLDDSVRILSGDLFDVRATLSAGDDYWALVRSLEGDSKVEFTPGEETLADHDHIARFALTTGLFGVQSVAEHVL